MLSRTLHQIRPAAGHRRRFFVCVTVTLCTLTGPACRAPEPIDDAAVRDAVQRAATEIRTLRPETLPELENMVLQAEVASRTARAHPRSAAARTLAQQAWLDAATAAARQVRSLRGEQNRARERWRAVHPIAAQRVADSARLLAGPGMGAAEASALARAQVQIGLAHRLAAAGDYEGAAAAAERAAEHAELPGRTWRTQHDRLQAPEHLRTWRRQLAEAVARSKRERSSLVVVDKLNREIHLYVAGRRTETFRAELGSNGLRRKRHAGDRATPEGLYRVVRKKEGAATIYHRALLLDYPNADDLRRFRSARASGEIPAGVPPGSLIEIHGAGGSGRDWTDGCVALANPDMDALYRRVSVGTPVLIIGAL